MNPSEYSFNLPDDLIARYPLDQRSASRLMAVSRENHSLDHYKFSNLLNILNANDLLVLNNTKVIPARLFGQKGSGGKVEVLIERISSEYGALAHLKANRSVKIGTEIYLDEDSYLTVTDRENDLFVLVANKPVRQILDSYGHIPLPPYLNREDEVSDRERYQTCFAKHEGAVAAPTASLHFDEELLLSIREKGVDIGYLTLHVGAGTFLPLREEQIATKRLHKEYMSVSLELCDKIDKAKANDGRVIAVGTTAVRSLETSGGKPFEGDTDIFIYPGYDFKIVDGMVTNFHLPESSLMMLVSAFAGRDLIMNAYQSAIENKYRFYSYGDAMVIL